MRLLRRILTINIIMRLIVFFIIFSFISCSPKSVGPNYNIGRTHNESKKNRMKVVYKEDFRMKREMGKARKKGTRGKVKGSKNFKKIIK